MTAYRNLEGRENKFNESTHKKGEVWRIVGFCDWARAKKTARTDHNGVPKEQKTRRSVA